MGQNDQMWILTSGGKQAERTRKKWSECYPWSVPVCGCVCVGGGLGPRILHMKPETRKFSSKSPADHRLSCGMGAKIVFLLLLLPEETLFILLSCEDIK